jgi:hypothetical protein
LNRCKLLGKDKNLCKPKCFSKRKMYPGVKQRQCNMLSSIEVTFHHKLLANLHRSKLEKTASYLVCAGESLHLNSYITRNQNFLTLNLNTWKSIVDYSCFFPLSIRSRRVSRPLNFNHIHHFLPFIHDN